MDSGEWLTHTPEGEPEGVLTGVLVDQTRRLGLVYQQPGDDQVFSDFPEFRRNKGGCHLVLNGKQ